MKTEIFKQVLKNSTKLLLALLLFTTLAHSEEWNTIWVSYPQVSTKVEFAPDDLTIGTLGSEGFMAVDAKTGKTLKQIDANRFCYSPDSKYLVIMTNGGEDGAPSTFSIYSNNDYKLIKNIPTTVGSLGGWGVTVTPDSKTIVGFVGDYFVTADIESGKIIKQSREWEHSNGVYILDIKTLNDINTFIFCSTAGVEAMVDINSLQIIKKYNHKINEISKDKSLGINVSDDDSVLISIMDLSTDKVICEIPGYNYAVRARAFSPDNKYIAVTYNYLKAQVQVYDINSKENVYNYTETPQTAFEALAWSNDTKYLAGSSGVRLYLYKAYPSVDVKDLETNGDTIIYPNPASDYLMISIDNIILYKISCNIFNNEGKLVKTLASNELTTDGNNLKINVTSLEPGIYFLNLLNGNSISTYKFIKE